MTETKGTEALQVRARSFVCRKTRPVQGLESPVISGGFHYSHGDTFYNTAAAMTTKHVSQRVQYSLMLRDRANEDTRIRNEMGTQLQAQQSVLRKEQAQRTIAEKTIAELSRRLDLMLMQKVRDLNVIRNLELDAERYQHKLKETEAQLAHARCECVASKLITSAIGGLLDEEQAKNARVTTIMKELDQQKTALEGQVQILEHHIRAITAQERFRTAGLKVLHDLRRKRWLMAKALLVKHIINSREKVKNAEIRALIWKGSFYAQIPLLERKFSEYVAEEHRFLDKSIANLAEVTTLESLSSSRTRSLTCDGALGFPPSEGLAPSASITVDSRQPAVYELLSESYNLSRPVSLGVNEHSPDHGFARLTCGEARKVNFTKLVGSANLEEGLLPVMSLQTITKNALQHTTSRTEVRLPLRIRKANNFYAMMPTGIRRKDTDYPLIPPPYTAIPRNASNSFVKGALDLRHHLHTSHSTPNLQKSRYASLQHSKTLVDCVVSQGIGRNSAEVHPSQKKSAKFPRYANSTVVFRDSPRSMSRRTPLVFGSRHPANFKPTAGSFPQEVTDTLNPHNVDVLAFRHFQPRSCDLRTTLG